MAVQIRSKIQQIVRRNVGDFRVVIITFSCSYFIHDYGAQVSTQTLSQPWETFLKVCAEPFAEVTKLMQFDLPSLLTAKVTPVKAHVTHPDHPRHLILLTEDAFSRLVTL